MVTDSPLVVVIPSQLAKFPDSKSSWNIVFVAGGGVGFGVGVGEAVGIGVEVGVGLGEAVGVGVGVAVGTAEESFSPFV